MEDDKKKKRNKKKKNKQIKITEDDIAVDVNQNGASNGKNDRDQVTDLAEVQNGAVRNGDTAANRHEHNGTEMPILAEAEKQQWVQREAILKESIKQLQNENDTYTQKEAFLEGRIKQLKKENDSQIQKLVTLEETIKQLRNVHDLALQKETTLEGTIQQLKNENDSHMKKEAGLENEIIQLQIEKESSLQKEAGLEKIIVQLQSEKESILQEEAHLKEQLQHLLEEKTALVLKGNTTKETIARMNVDITRLQMQVVELEESRNILLKENQQLMDNISGQRLHLQNVKANVTSANTSHELKKHDEREDLNSQIGAACALVDKLITENAELVEKVNELYIKLDQQSRASGHSSTIGSDLMVESRAADSILESSEKMSALGHKMELLEVEPAAGDAYAAEVDSGEIVQIPLNDNELRDLELKEAVENDKMEEAVPLTDAPMIGAPFRLISFVAKYVSGADLVDKSTSNSVP
ncbi:nucleoporin nup211 isoform X2 [Hevea brasiliensis]|uniref:nucleoporin nup211 isoform X2 n=1 Tax=Hevea brasiliensis TaxID=3981 RepID=UPI0025DCB23B|nr:nucleoporin nup211 isoform X2 [Hevea brasiliensis]